MTSNQKVSKASSYGTSFSNVPKARGHRPARAQDPPAESGERREVAHVDAHAHPLETLDEGGLALPLVAEPGLAVGDQDEALGQVEVGDVEVPRHGRLGDPEAVPGRHCPAEGSIQWPSFSVSKWRWGQLLKPLLPVRPSCVPAVTACPGIPRRSRLAGGSTRRSSPAHDRRSRSWPGCGAPLGVHVRLAVVGLHHHAVAHGEDRHADRLLAEAADQRVVAVVVVVGLLGAVPVPEDPEARVLIGEVGQVEVLALDPGLGEEGVEEGESSFKTLGARAFRFS